MREIWLRNNRRVLWLSMIPPSIVAGIGLFLILGMPHSADWLRIVGWVLLGMSVLFLAAVTWQGRMPRLAYADGDLVVHLTGQRPDRVPIDVVECFFLGTGRAPVAGQEGGDVPIRNLVVRLAERAQEFHERPVKAALGTWHEGYITIHGAWCEPLTLELVNRLNARLAEVQRSNVKATAERNA